jgi:hypothetical protein
MRYNEMRISIEESPMSEEQMLTALRALRLEVEANIADLDAEQERLDALLGRSEREERAA